MDTNCCLKSAFRTHFGEKLSIGSILVSIVHYALDFQAQRFLEKKSDSNDQVGGGLVTGTAVPRNGREHSRRSTRFSCGLNLLFAAEFYLLHVRRERSPTNLALLWLEPIRVHFKKLFGNEAAPDLVIHLHGNALTKTQYTSAEISQTKPYFLK